MVEEAPESATATTKQQRGQHSDGHPVRPEDPGPSPTLEGIVALDYALRVGPALQHAASMAVMWAALQVQQYQALLSAHRLCVLCSNLPNVRQEAFCHADRVIERYTGANDIASIREPYAELCNTWHRVNSDPTTSFAQQTATTAQTQQSGLDPSPSNTQGRAAPQGPAVTDTSAVQSDVLFLGGSQQDSNE